MHPDRERTDDRLVILKAVRHGGELALHNQRVAIPLGPPQRNGIVMQHHRGMLFVAQPIHSAHPCRYDADQ